MMHSVGASKLVTFGDPGGEIIQANPRRVAFWIPAHKTLTLIVGLSADDVANANNAIQAATTGLLVSLATHGGMVKRPWYGRCVGATPVIVIIESESTAE